MEWRATGLNMTVNLTTVNDAPTLVKGVYVNDTLSAHQVLIKDGTMTMYKIPASTTAGTRIDFGPTQFDTSLVIDPDDSATGTITIEYVDLAPDRR